jgi:hypothetical protein
MPAAHVPDNAIFGNGPGITDDHRIVGNLVEIIQSLPVAGTIHILPGIAGDRFSAAPARFK